jgi:hypothetical protein
MSRAKEEMDDLERIQRSVGLIVAIAGGGEKGESAAC